MAEGVRLKIYRTEFKPKKYGADHPMDVVISFDTTSSMNKFLVDVRKDIAETMKKIFGKIKNVRIAIFAHGDYCDFGKTSSYLTKFEDFTNDELKLQEFVKNVGGTGGGDTAECYELVLKEIREKLSWRSGSQRALIMIGDAYPHEWKDYHDEILAKYPDAAKVAVDWRDEAEKLVKMDCHIYPFQYGKGDSKADAFWEALAYVTYSHRIHLSGTTNTLILILAVVYKEKGEKFLTEFTESIKEEHSSGLPEELNIAFVRLKAVPGSKDAIDVLSATTTEWLTETDEERQMRKVVERKEKKVYLVEEKNVTEHEADLLEPEAEPELEPQAAPTPAPRAQPQGTLKDETWKVLSNMMPLVKDQPLLCFIIAWLSCWMAIGSGNFWSGLLIMIAVFFIPQVPLRE